MKAQVALGAVLALVVSCTSSTSLVRSWHDDSYKSGSLRKPLVVAVASQPMIRLKIEDELVRGLRGIGIDAVASHSSFAERDLTVDVLREKLPSSDRDSVMVTHLVDVKLETVVVPEQTETYGSPAVDYPRYADNWPAYYSHSYSVVTSPSYAYQTKKYVLETTLYDVKTEKRVWSAVTRSNEPESLDEAVETFANVIVKDVQKTRMF